MINLIGEDGVHVSSILETGLSLGLSKRWNVVALQTIEVVHIMARWCTSKNQITALYARCTVARAQGPRDGATTR